MHVALGVRTLRFSIPLGPAYLSAVLKRDGHRVSIFEFGADQARWLESLVAGPPDIAAYSVLSGEQADALRFHRLLRSRIPVRSILGGPHPTFFPEIILDDGVDAICVGEGEEALSEFVGRFAATGEWPTDVRNFHVKSVTGEVVENPVRPLIESLDYLPHPDRALFLDAHPILRHHGVRHFIAQRGCPNRCTFCFNRSYNQIYEGKGTVHRVRDPEKVCEEVDRVRRAGWLGMASFVDDSFAHDPAWLARFCDCWERDVRLPYSCNLRPDGRIPDLAGRLAASGCRLAYVGLEAGTSKSRNLLGRPMEEATIRETVEALNRHGIRTITENMVGIPGEDLEAALATLKLNQDIGPTVANCSIFTPYPGLPLTDHAIRNGWFDGDFSRLEGNYYRTSVLSFGSDAERNRIVNLRAFFSVFSRHPGLWPLLRPLLSLPPNRLFETFGALADGHYLRQCLPYRQGPVRTLRLLLGYLKFYR